MAGPKQQGARIPVFRITSAAAPDPCGTELSAGRGDFTHPAAPVV